MEEREKKKARKNEGDKKKGKLTINHDNVGFAVDLAGTFLAASPRLFY